MKMKQSIDRKKKPYGPHIVRAWFDTVFHYALRGLENERSLLVDRNWTFRFRSRALEYLGPLIEHCAVAFFLAQVGAHAAKQFAERLSALNLSPPHAGILRRLSH
jgi:hypothetical protein